MSFQFESKRDFNRNMRIGVFPYDVYSSMIVEVHSSR
nr:MAG TPA: hypothetical protein [Caudoviricetes sp.]